MTDWSGHAAFGWDFFTDSVRDTVGRITIRDSHNRVVATYRTGIPPGEPEVDSTTLRLRADDPRNHADVRRFLNQAVAEERLAGRLAECGVPAAEFTEALAERCRGVWVYLRYVLREIRLGLRRPDDVDNLPTDLTGYYAKTLGADQHSPQWVEVHLPLLATLAAAREPLPAEALARLAGLPDTHAVQRLCDVRYRPLLTATGLPRTYAIYHASLREFLTGTLSTQPDTSLPDHLHALAATFAGATHAAHARIADHYLTRFGGLDTGLAALAADPALADLDDGYPLRHLAAHLDHAGQIEDLHRLLACERPTGSGSATNVWFDAHDRAGTLDRYLTDLDRARCQVEQETDARLRAGRQAPSLGLELRYVLMAASINSITSNVPIPLLERLVETGIWDTTRALTHARRLHEPSIRCNALVALLPRLSDDQRPAIVREALETAHAITDKYFRVEALEALAPHLSEELLRKALEIAHAITNEGDRVRALAALAPHLPGDQRPAVVREALETAHAITDKYFRVEALEALAPHLPDDQRPAVLVGLFREMSWANHFGSVLLEQACRFRQPDVDVIAIGFLRRSCWIKRRRECLALIRAAIPTIQACGGESAIHQLIRAMRKVQQWWP
ncbi:hypothetical protein [Thermasporomyces composti]|uniref:hypothetical protein n=1 Tax=Thermasporomyces composti TaxID=696763 RepID=UPI0011C01864|nr:hypothetical protein [Thermasporomyces composti]